MSSPYIKFGQGSLYLNGSAYIIANSTAFSSVNISDFEFDVWYYPLDVSAHRCIAHIHADTYRGLHVHISGGTIILDDGATTVPATPAVITMANTWYHIRISGDYLQDGNAILRVFVNGVKLNELMKNSYSLNFATPTKFSLGKFFTDGALSNAYGYFDELVFRNTVTTRESFTPPTTPESL